MCRAALVCLFLVLALSAWSDDESLEARVHAVLDQTPLIDGHNDLPYVYTLRARGHLDEMPFTDDLTKIDQPTHTDLTRLRDGRVGGQFWSVYIPIKAYPGAPGDTTQVLRQIDLVHRLIERHPDALALALTSEDIRRIHKSRKILIRNVAQFHGILP